MESKMVVEWTAVTVVRAQGVAEPVEPVETVVAVLPEWALDRVAIEMVSGGAAQ